MGQQQLLLLVLGIVIVGLAVVAGINAFSENQKKSNRDALVTEAFRLATDAQAWKLKPSQYGGGGGEFDDFTFGKLSVAASNLSNTDLTYSTPWGDVVAAPDAASDTLSLELTDQNGTGVGKIGVKATGEVNYYEPAAEEGETTP